MSAADLDERAWHVFALPASTAIVPASTEADARAVLASHSYPGAPVASYPLVATRWTSRAAIVAELLRKAAAA